MAKTYGQFCGAARALDHVGDRWTLLVIRELLLADASYGELLTALDGIPTNLLADRLRKLEADGLITRDTDHEDRRRVQYRLTPHGSGLEAVLHELIRWGAHWMHSGPGNDRFDPRWAVLAMRALLQGRTTPRRGSVELHVTGGPLLVVSTGDAPLRIQRSGSAHRPDATVNGDATLLLGLISGHMTFTAAARHGVRVRGDRDLALALLRP
jgi:DNA-binding HxlR family transcriptional regulator